MRNNEPLVSMIIPVFNGEKYIDEIMQCIIKQTYKNIEVLFVNDGSTDNTVDKVLCWSDDNRIRLINKENGGASSARNLGLSKAKGEYIAFVDVDDYIFPDYISYLYELIEKNNADISCCNYLKLNHNEKLTIKDKDRRTLFNTEEALLDFLYRKKLTGYPVLKLIKKGIIDGISFPEGIAYCEDFIVIMQAIRRSKRVAYGSRILYLYYQHANSATHNFNSLNAWQSWVLVKNTIYNLCNTAVLDKAGEAKMFILSADFCSRIWKDQTAHKYKQDMIDELIRTRRSVAFNPQAKRANRVLAIICCINPVFMIYCCRYYTSLKRAFKFETRRSL